jgi:hypothetical protein
MLIPMLALILYQAVHLLLKERTIPSNGKTNPEERVANNQEEVEVLVSPLVGQIHQDHDPPKSGVDLGTLLDQIEKEGRNSNTLAILRGELLERNLILEDRGPGAVPKSGTNIYKDPRGKAMVIVNVEVFGEQVDTCGPGARHKSGTNAGGLRARINKSRTKGPATDQERAPYHNERPLNEDGRPYPRRQRGKTNAEWRKVPDATINKERESRGQESPDREETPTVQRQLPKETKDEKAGSTTHGSHTTNAKGKESARVQEPTPTRPKGRKTQKGKQREIIAEVPKEEQTLSNVIKLLDEGALERDEIQFLAEALETPRQRTTPMPDPEDKGEGTSQWTGRIDFENTQILQRPH